MGGPAGPAASGLRHRDQRVRREQGSGSAFAAQPSPAAVAWRGSADNGKRGVANLGERLVHPGDVHDPQQRGPGRGQLERPAGTPRVPGDPGEHTEARRVAEGELGQVHQHWPVLVVHHVAQVGIGLVRGGDVKLAAYPHRRLAVRRHLACQLKLERLRKVDHSPHVPVVPPVRRCPVPCDTVRANHQGFPSKHRSELNAPSAPASPSHFVLILPSRSASALENSEGREPYGRAAQLTE